MHGNDIEKSWWWGFLCKTIGRDTIKGKEMEEPKCGPKLFARCQMLMIMMLGITEVIIRESFRCDLCWICPWKGQPPLKHSWKAYWVLIVYTWKLWRWNKCVIFFTQVLQIQQHSILLGVYYFIGWHRPPFYCLNCHHQKHNRHYHHNQIMVCLMIRFSSDIPVFTLISIIIVIIIVISMAINIITVIIIIFVSIIIIR